MIREAITIATIGIFIGALAVEALSLKDTAASLKSSVVILQNTQNKYLELLDKPFDKINQNDYNYFSKSNIEKLQEDNKKLALAEIDKEAEELKNTYASINLENVKMDEVNQEVDRLIDYKNTKIEL